MANVHIVIAHPRDNSFNCALLGEAIDALEKDHNLVVSDLYSFLASNHPAIQPFGTKRSEKDQLLIKEEQNKITSSDLTIIQFPLYWFSFPGILKNYWEQVLEPGFAYPGKFSGSPLCDGRNVLFSITTQSRESDFSDVGQNAPMKDILCPLAVAFRFVGYNILEPFVAYNVTDKKESELKKILKSFSYKVKQAAKNPEVWLTVEKSI